MARAERGRRRARAREGDDRRGDGLRRPRGGRRGAGRGDAGARGVVEWTAETVEALAPDAASVTAARKLARPAPWSETGRDERAVWGLCKGSGSTPYQVAGRPTGPAYKCSCPSRKVPCKHALALLLLRAGGERARRASRRSGWRVARRARARRRPARAPGEPPRDPEAAARRAAEREERVAGGRRGPAAVAARRRARRARRRPAARPGTSGTRSRRGWSTRRRRARPRGCGRSGSVAAGRPDGWPERLLSGIGLLHLLCEAHARADGPLRDDVRTLLGWNVAREDVLAGPRVRDRWSVLARVVIEQERLRVQRTWLWGQRARARRRCCSTSRRRARRSSRARRPGTAVEAALAFYPGATPLRALSPASRRPSTTRPGAFGTGGASRRRSRARPRRSPRTRGSTSGRSRSRAAVPDGRTWTLRRAEDGSLPLRRSSARAGGCSRSPAGARCPSSGCGTATRSTPLAAGDGERTVAL